jgi:hypothetical protein
MQNKRFDIHAPVLSFMLAGGAADEALRRLNLPKWIFVPTTCKALHRDGYGVAFCLNDFPTPSQLKPSRTSTYFISLLLT